MKPFRTRVDRTRPLLSGAFRGEGYFWAMKVLMVCLGNICRSPMAEGILSSMAEQEGLGWRVDSAGTGSWHIGEQPDRRAIATCDQNGLDIRHQRARQIRPGDLEAFDLILAMDENNYQDILRMARSKGQREKVRMITAFGNTPFREVPDPYFDGSFVEVYRLLEELCREIIRMHR